MINVSFSALSLRLSNLRWLTAFLVWLQGEPMKTGTSPGRWCSPTWGQVALQTGTARVTPAFPGHSSSCPHAPERVPVPFCSGACPLVLVERMPAVLWRLCWLGRWARRSQPGPVQMLQLKAEAASAEAAPSLALCSWIADAVLESRSQSIYSCAHNLIWWAWYYK